MVFLVLAIAFILRFYQLGNIPLALDWDEASTGYNAYSILKTGKDEFGQSFPFLFRAFDGYVPPLLIYINTASILVFGLSEFAVRFPNALLGVLSVWGVYLLVLQLSRNRKFAGLAALFLAISPWHVTYSRVDFFATLPVVFVIFAAYFFVLSLKQKLLLTISLTFFVLAIFSYFAAYVFVPLFALGLVILFWSNFKFLSKVFFVSILFFVSFYIMFLAKGGQARLRGVSAFSDPDIVKESASAGLNDGLVGKLLHNRRFVYTEKFLEGYFASFRYDFLFGKFDNVARMVVPGEGFGLMLLVDLPFLLVGAYELIKKRDVLGKVMFLWLAAAPVAAAPTLPQMTSTRAFLMVVPLAAISAFGFLSLVNFKKPLVRLVLVGFVSLNFFMFAHNYFLHFSSQNASKWFWGYKQLFAYLDLPGNSTSKVHFVFRGHDNLDQVYIFSLFYRKVDPAKWQENGGTKLGCLGTTGQFSFERYDFIPSDCLARKVNSDKFSDDDLVVTTKSKDSRPLVIINNPDGAGAFFVYRWGNLKTSPKLVFGEGFK